MARFKGFFGLKDNIETLALAYALWGVTAILFIMVMCGCATVPMRMFYIAECGDISFGYVGMCNDDGAVCVGSLVKPALEVAYQLKSQEATIQDFQNLQNDVSFALPMFSLFSYFVALFWITVLDRDEKTETESYQLWPCLIMWSAVGFSWTAAWDASFTVSVLIDSRTGCKRGTIIEGFLWTMFLLTLVGGIAVIRYAYDVVRTEIARVKTLWKTKYINLITPKDKLVQSVQTPSGQVTGVTQRMVSDELYQLGI